MIWTSASHTNFVQMLTENFRIRNGINVGRFSREPFFDLQWAPQNVKFFWTLVFFRVLFISLTKIENNMIGASLFVQLIEESDYTKQKDRELVNETSTSWRERWKSRFGITSHCILRTCIFFLFFVVGNESSYLIAQRSQERGGAWRLFKC